MKTKNKNTGRITPPRGKTANDRAKERVSIPEGVMRAMFGNGAVRKASVSEARAGVRFSEANEPTPASKLPIADIKLTQQELDTVIAALRLWQASVEGRTHGDVVIDEDRYIAIEDIAGDHGGMLTVSAIDKLVERINCGQAPAVTTTQATEKLKLSNTPSPESKPEPKTVYITVEGGVAEIGERPPGVEVEIIDYDNLQTGGKAEFDQYPEESQKWIIEHNQDDPRFLQAIGITSAKK